MHFSVCLSVSSILLYKNQSSALGMLQKSRTPTAGVAILLQAIRQFFQT